MLQPRPNGDGVNPEQRTPIPATTEAWLQPVHGKRIPLEGTCSIGRLAENQVVIDQIKASRHHAAIYAQDVLEFWLVDLGSRNGTWHNGRRILRPTLLADGDRILIADVNFVFRQVTTAAPGFALPQPGMETLVEFRDQNALLLMADLCNATVWIGQHTPQESSSMLSTWIGNCQETIERHQGQVGKYLGDGLLAYWTDNAAPAAVAGALAELAAKSNAAMPFRVALHYGVVTFGGATSLGEERMIGSAVNFIFRLERLASTHGIRCCLSQPAQQFLKSAVVTEPVEGEFELQGFSKRQRVFRAAW